MSESWTRRLQLLAAVMMVGDGVVALASPSAIRLWQIGPRSYRRVVAGFLAHPWATRLVGAGEAAFGVWLARAAASGRGEARAGVFPAASAR